MDFHISWMAFALGVLVGIICIGGLGLGVKILLQTQQNAALRPGQRRNRYALAALILIAQLGIAMALLFKTPWVRSSPIGVAGGLMLSILFSSALMHHLSNYK